MQGGTLVRYRVPTSCSPIPSSTIEHAVRIAEEVFYARTLSRVPYGSYGSIVKHRLRTLRFSVSIGLSASGCKIIAKMRRRATSHQRSSVVLEALYWPMALKTPWDEGLPH
jgi:hypothetical protein